METVERNQVRIYICSLIAGLAVGYVFNLSSWFEALIPVALVSMLFATFMQVPLSVKSVKNIPKKMVVALVLTQFVALPLLVYLLLFFAPEPPLIRLAILFVLLTPCIDYVITFTHLVKGNAGLLLRLTPLLLVVQMLCLPFYLRWMLGMPLERYLNGWDMLYTLVPLLGVPLGVAMLVQEMKRRPGPRYAQTVYSAIDKLPVPTTALVLFVVLGAVVPYVGQVSVYVWRILPLYLAFALLAPCIALVIGKAFGLCAENIRALGMSAAYRNSLVILPMALALPDSGLLVPAVILLQTMTELLLLPLYLRVISTW